MNKKQLSPAEKDKILLEGIRAVLNGDLTEGELLNQLRKKVLGITQQRYATLVGISRRTLSDIENGKTQVSFITFNRVLKPLGLKLSLLPRSANLVAKLLNEKEK